VARAVGVVAPGGAVASADVEGRGVAVVERLAGSVRLGSGDEEEEPVGRAVRLILELPVDDGDREAVVV
jgi:hypothetical protein